MNDNPEQQHVPQDPVIAEPLPPPASQSHFAKYESADFTPDDNAPFESEFASLASSQSWVPGSQEYSRHRTIALLESSEEEAIEIRRNGYQALCREVGIDPPPFKIGECKNRLKNTLVNIVDLIDAQRTGKRVEVWKDFASFRKYTLLPEHRISKEDVKGTELASLLQDLRSDRPGRERKRIGADKRGWGLLSSGNRPAKSWE
ncbi:hypothetical protein B0T14DRAFT_542925 [Immersiella caudata]|uniref:Uncharacterized protein n=1 Tax=Immersiella caudata TaxID=314043 RepID=A0AA40CCX6_9PEZI|nr:hypothetical protein B0T14DRAFT_542925 [Immersiella caudata]